MSASTRLLHRRLFLRRLRAGAGLAGLGIAAPGLFFAECANRAGAAPAPPTGDGANRAARADRADRANRAFALLGAEIHTGDGEILRDGVLLLRGERIVAVGGPELQGRLGGATPIDLQGKLVTPGLIAADTPLGLVEIGAEASTRDDSGEGPIRAAYDAATAIHSRSSLLQVQAVEGITSAAIAPTGGLLSGQVAWIDLLHGDLARMVQRRAIAQSGALGQQIAGSRAATLAKLREVLSDARFYRGRRGAHDRRQLRDLAAHPRDLAALVPVLERTIPLTLRADRESDIAAALDLAAEERLRLVILGGAEAWRLRDRLAAARVPVIVHPSHNLPSSLDRLGARLDNAALLSAAGVDVGIATLGDTHNLRNATQEAGIAVAYGMDWEKALTAVTLAIARAYGVDADYGSLRPGKVANLVVWGGDPFEFEHFAEQVYIRGEAIPMVSRQTLLRERYRER